MDRMYPSYTTTTNFYQMDQMYHLYTITTNFYQMNQTNLFQLIKLINIRTRRVAPEYS